MTRKNKRALFAKAYKKNREIALCDLMLLYNSRLNGSGDTFRIEQVNDVLIKNDEQPLEIIVDGKNVISKKGYWKSEENCLKIDTNTKNIELKQDIGGIGIKQLEKNFLRDLNKTQSINQSLNNFLRDLKDRENKRKKVKSDPGLEMAGFFITGGFILSLVVIGLLDWIKQDYY